jgi:hypothetical protein
MVVVVSPGILSPERMVHPISLFWQRAGKGLSAARTVRVP